ncbi:MAG: diacylglycerol/lipid kinase family protein [Solirubrobacterales bacterium]
MSTATVRRPPRASSSANGRAAPVRANKLRMLIIVNPYATTVSDRLKNLVVYALQGRYEVEAVSTEARDHATEIGLEARDGDYDVVVAFGGDGTLNEVANGLAGTGVPVSVLPGGSTNVVCRTLGIPNDVVDATEHLLGLADRFEPRRVDLGIANGRRFVFACGAGLDATTTQRVDARPRLKARGGRWFYTSVAVSSFYTRYMRDPVRLRLEVPDGSAEGITAVTQNSDPFTYFGPVPVRVCDGVAIDDGTLAVAMLRRAAQRDVPTVIARVLSSGLRLADHRHIEHFSGITEGRIESLSRDRAGRPRPFPVEVDGDYIGEHAELELGIDPGALTVVA